MFAALMFAALLSGACGIFQTAQTKTIATSVPSAAPLTSEDAATDNAVRFLENKVKNDPEDFSAHNKLAMHYLRLAREKDDDSYLELAARSARLSLQSVPVERNFGGLYALAQYEQATHNFPAARDHARQLIKLSPGKIEPYLLLGDALLEFGDYEEATAVFQNLRQTKGSNAEIVTRLARLSVLRGDYAQAKNHFSNALAIALDSSYPSRDAVAWCRWQLGEIAFATGDYETAESNYRDALTTYPDYTLALASQARVRAARGDLPKAIEIYEQIVKRSPHPEHMAALGDYYRLAEREADADAQYGSVEEAARDSAHDNRLLALFYADHEINAEEAYARAKKEYELRHDIYTADAVGWTALKAGKISEAQTAIKDALRLGTKDARLFYHAGMIARAAGDEVASRDFLRRALELNPKFDLLQAEIAQKLLGN